MKNRIKITLISFYEGLVAAGLRIISSYLKEFGHEVEMIFFTVPRLRFSDSCNKEALDDLINLCESSDLIGFSIMTNYFLKARELTVKIKEKLDKPIIWGGIHPTVKPEECLQYADMVCVGEGEEAMLELANSLKSTDITNIKNIWFKDGNRIIKNDIRPLEECLDKYPFPDYDINTHYLLKGNRIVKLTEGLLKDGMTKYMEPGKFSVTYQVMTARNCPHNCAYCHNSATRKIYAKKGKFVRKRNLENVIRELELIKNRFGFIRKIEILDDTFFIRSKEEIKMFCEYYKEKINLPVKCHLYPSAIDEDSLKLMIDAGLFRVSMGIQSYSYHTLTHIYKRPTPKNVILENIRIIDKYRLKIPNPMYHIIIDNPYETKEAKKENIEFIASLPRGTAVCLFPLVFYPGTELYERAKKDGIIKNEIEDVYLKSMEIDALMKRCDYLTFLIYMFTLQNIYIKFLMKKLRKVLLSDEAIYLFDNKIFVNLIFPALKRIRTRAAVMLRRFIRKFDKRK